MTVHVFTSFTYAYLNRARVLVATLKRHHPDWVFWAVITDEPPEGFEFRLEDEDFDRIMTTADLIGPDYLPWLFGHNVVEACTAVKGAALRHILDQDGADKILYLDPDIAIFGPLDPIIELLEDHSFVLTPHQTAPDDTRHGIIDNEIASLHYGAYNLGFLAVRNDGEVRRFAEWWDTRLRDWCHDRLDIGVFVDQKWCNLIPCFYEGVKVLRDPGYNVASWNLSTRDVRITAEGRIEVNGHALRFYHFTKLGPVGDTMTRRYAGSNTDVHELWWWYRGKVAGFTDPAIPDGWWHFGRFADGQAIDQRMRKLYRSRVDLQRAFANPFLSGPGTYAQWLAANPQEWQGG